MLFYCPAISNKDTTLIRTPGCLSFYRTAVFQVLVLDTVFYVIALLNLPKVWMTGVFLLSVKEASEALVATRRLYYFLQEVEATTPAQNNCKGKMCDPVPLQSLNFAADGFLLSLKSGVFVQLESCLRVDILKGSIEFRGANFSWGSGAWAGLPDTTPGKTPKSDESLHHSAQKIDNTAQSTPICRGASSQTDNEQDGVISTMEKANTRAELTLHAPMIKVSPGEFIGVTGEVRL